MYIKRTRKNKSKINKLIKKTRKIIPSENQDIKGEEDEEEK